VPRPTFDLSIPPPPPQFPPSSLGVAPTRYLYSSLPFFPKKIFLQGLSFFCRSCLTPLDLSLWPLGLLTFPMLEPTPFLSFRFFFNREGSFFFFFNSLAFFQYIFFPLGPVPLFSLALFVSPRNRLHSTRAFPPTPSNLDPPRKRA